MQGHRSQKGRRDEGLSPSQKEKYQATVHTKVRRDNITARQRETESLGPAGRREGGTKMCSFVAQRRCELTFSKSSGYRIR